MSPDPSLFDLEIRHLFAPAFLYFAPFKGIYTLMAP